MRQSALLTFTANFQRWWKAIGLTTVSVSSLVISLSLTGQLQLLEWAAFDWFFQQRPAEPKDDRIVIVAIDESDIIELGQWPMSDRQLAQLLEEIIKQNPLAIGLDLYRDLPVEPGHGQLLELFESTSNVIGIEKVINNTVNPPPALEQKNQVAIANVISDADGARIRRGLLFLDSDEGEAQESLGMKLALMYLEDKGITPELISAEQLSFKLGNTIFYPLKPYDGGYAGADVGGYQVLLNLRGPSCEVSKSNCSFDLVSATDVIKGRVPLNFMHDRIVLIGATAASLGDMFYAAYSTSEQAVYSGVEIHAHLASQIISTALDGRTLIRTWSEPIEWLWIMGWSAWSATLGVSFLLNRWGVPIGLVATGFGIVGISYLAFLNGWWLPVFTPILGMSGTGVISISYVMLRNLQEYTQTLGQKVTERTAELHRTQALFAKAFALNPAPMTLTSWPDGIHLKFNRSFLKITGYSPNEVEHKTARDLNIWVNPEERQRFFELLKSEGTVEYFEMQYRTKHGKIRTALLSAELLNHLYGEGQHGVLGVSSDITDRKAIEKELERANRAKSDFLAGMSHELRTPLNAILGFSKIMAKMPMPNPEFRDYLEIIGRSGEHLLSLINDVLDLSKIEAGKITLDVNEFNLYQLLKTIEEMLKLRASSKELELIFQLSPNLSKYIATDEKKLKQVLINLLGNAIKFTQKGYILLKVKQAHQGDQTLNEDAQITLHFAVEDTGPGIAPEEMQTLFEAFGQTAMGRKASEGTGLGLAISRQFVQLMGGDIHVKSIVGEGTTFTFEIQATPVEDIGAQNAVVLDPIALQPGQPNYRLLVVDDRPENRLLMVKLLEPIGFQIKTVENGQEAVQLWETWRPQLIWMDMQMPVMNGYEATEKIRQLEMSRGQDSTEDSTQINTKIIAFTANALVEERSRMFAAGCDDIVYKPFQERVIFDQLAEHLGIEYIYPQFDKVLDQSGEILENLEADALKGMPYDWLMQLHHAAIAGNDEVMLQLLEQIPDTENATIPTLDHWIRDFRFDKITCLTENIIQNPTE